MNGAYLNKLLGLNASQALYRQDGKWYHHLKRFPGVLFDAGGYVRFATAEEYLNQKELSHSPGALHVTVGISTISHYREFSEYERKLVAGVTDLGDEQLQSSEESLRVVRAIEMILRNRKLVQELKELYADTCQICGIRIPVRNGKYYSEVHHIIPLGRPHDGPDKLDNMICVCPNHHVELDMRSRKIGELKVSKHKISEESIEYHNSRCL